MTGIMQSERDVHIDSGRAVVVILAQYHQIAVEPGRPFTATENSLRAAFTAPDPRRTNPLSPPLEKASERGTPS